MVSVMLYPCILCVALLVYLFGLCVACLTVFVNCLVKQFCNVFGCCCYFVILLSVYSPFSDRVGLPLHNTPFSGALIKSIGAAFIDRMPFLTSTTCVGCNMCYVFNVYVTDSFDDRWSQCRMI